MEFHGQQLASAIDAMADAFPNRARLQQLLEFRLSKQLDVLVGGGGLRDVLFELFQISNAEGWSGDLIRVARLSNPGNSRLMAFAEGLGLAVAPGAQLERWVREGNALLDLPTWLGRLGAIERQVCRIEADRSYGTGFLVGPDLVLTNAHVVANAAAISARFDFRRGETGDSDGTPVEVVATVHSSSVDQFDYALLRIAAPFGELRIGANPEPQAKPRGWMTPTPSTFAASSPIFIVQHPRATPISLALDTTGVIGLLDEKRVRYRTNTEPGSSGSPCFDQQWNLIAMHRSGDPGLAPAEYNEGIPIMAIVANLQQAHIELRPPSKE